VNDIHIRNKGKEEQMTNGKKLDEAIKNSGISITFIAEKLGCSRNRIYAILANGECTASEIVGLTAILHLSRVERDEIFLPENVN
jgi:plasmid maintenance system antidote protein VapI